MDFQRFPLLDQPILDAVRRRLRLHRLSMTEMSARSGLSYGWLRHFLAGHNEGALQRFNRLILLLRELDQELDADKEERCDG